MPPALLPYWPVAAVFAGLLLLSAVARRVPFVRGLVSLATWGLLAWLLVVALGERGRIDPMLDRVATWLRLDGQEVAGDTVRVAMAPDGHFWVRARIGAVERRLLVDSGATMTALSPATAAAAGLTVREPAFPILVRTANGTVTAGQTTVPALRFGTIVARDLAAVVSPAFGDMDVLGMNFLSRLKGWRVEGRTLILEPHHPQPASGEVGYRSSRSATLR